LFWITFPAHDGSDDREPRQTADITIDVVSVNVHQRQSLLHSKLLLSRRVNDVAARAMVVAQLADLRRRPKGAP
jgi:hypothetical protein